MKFKNLRLSAVILVFYTFSAKALPLAAAPLDSSKNLVPSRGILFKNKTHHARSIPKELWIRSELGGSFEERDAYYAGLNASLDPFLADKPHTPTGDEKMWGLLAGSASAAMAGVAAAQATGILPGKPKSK